MSNQDDWALERICTLASGTLERMSNQDDGALERICKWASGTLERMSNQDNGHLKEWRLRRMGHWKE